MLIKANMLTTTQCCHPVSDLYSSKVSEENHGKVLS